MRYRPPFPRLPRASATTGFAIPSRWDWLALRSSEYFRERSPIGSGPIEAACRHGFKQRERRSLFVQEAVRATAHRLTLQQIRWMHPREAESGGILQNRWMVSRLHYTHFPGCCVEIGPRLRHDHPANPLDAPEESSAVGYRTARTRQKRHSSLFPEWRFTAWRRSSRIPRKPSFSWMRT